MVYIFVSKLEWSAYWRALFLVPYLFYLAFNMSSECMFVINVLFLSVLYRLCYVMCCLCTHCAVLFMLVGWWGFGCCSCAWVRTCSRVASFCTCCRTIMAVPIIDGVDWNNFRYQPVYAANEHYRGIFEWGFLYKESKVPERELSTRQHNSEPYRWVMPHNQRGKAFLSQLLICINILNR